MQQLLNSTLFYLCSLLFPFSLMFWTNTLSLATQIMSFLHSPTVSLSPTYSMMLLPHVFGKMRLHHVSNPSSGCSITASLTPILALAPAVQTMMDLAPSVTRRRTLNICSFTVTAPRVSGVPLDFLLLPFHRLKLFGTLPCLNRNALPCGGARSTHGVPLEFVEMQECSSFQPCSRIK